jgi:sucrose-6-phosphate hydrolase SacC (GH32 family)
MVFSNGIKMALVAAMAFGAPATAADAGYLLVHFTSETTNGEQIYFATSKDGLHWQDLNNSRPVLQSDLGEKGVRDPAIVRAADGKKFYILATDLRIESGKGWDAAMHRGSTALIIYESSDLVNWSAPRSVDIAKGIPGAGCAWAPEAIYDEASGQYIVYWATISPLNGVDKARIYYSTTRDFLTFSPAQLYIDRPGNTPIIDTQIVKMSDRSSGYRYYRASGDGQITLEGSDQILGNWKTIGDLRSVGLTGKDVEGPILFKFNGSEQWSLWVDQYATGKGYLALVSSNLSNAGDFRRLAVGEVDFGKSKKRHGSILNLSAAQYQALMSKWAPQP